MLRQKKNEKDLKYGRKNHFEIEDTYGGNHEIKCTYGNFVIKNIVFQNTIHKW